MARLFLQVPEGGPSAQVQHALQGQQGALAQGLVHGDLGLEVAQGEVDLLAC